MALRLIQFRAIMLTALALVPSGAHLAALPNKMAMAQPAYFIAQQIYAGCALFWDEIFEGQPAGLSPPGAPRSVREPLDSYGSRCSAVSMAEPPVGKERWICPA